LVDSRNKLPVCYGVSSNFCGCSPGSDPFSGEWREGIYESVTTTTGKYSALNATIMIRDYRDPWVYLNYETDGKLEFSQVSST